LVLRFGCIAHKHFIVVHTCVRDCKNGGAADSAKRRVAPKRSGVLESPTRRVTPKIKL